MVSSTDLIMTDEIHNTSPNDAWIAAACGVTKDLLDQLTQRDSPPSNDDYNIASTTSSDLLKTKPSSSPTQAAGDSSFGSNSSSSDMDDFFDDLVGKPRLEDSIAALDLSKADLIEQAEPAVVVQAYSRIGHASLVHLCRESLQQEKEDPWIEQIQKQSTPRAATMTGAATLEPLDIMESPTKVMISNATIKSKPPKKRSFWNKRRAFSGEEKKEDHSSSASSTKPSTTRQQQPLPKRQLHQFASEYARHLSNSPFGVAQVLPGAKLKGEARNKFNLKSSMAQQHNQSETFSLENAPPDVKTGAIIDIVIVDKDSKSPPPQGYWKLSQTSSGQPTLLAHEIFVRKEVNWDKATQRPTVTAVTLIFPDDQEFVPPGFCVARKDGVPANVGRCSGKRCYLVFRRSREGNPLTGLSLLLPPETVPTGYTVVERTPRNRVASLTGTNGQQLFLAYRQRLANLEVLRPMPLLRTVQPKAGADFTDETDDDEGDCYYSDSAKQLRAYYATGATIVSSNVGRLHIMDRSTHSLQSPGSVASRLHLMEASRRKLLVSAPLSESNESGNGQITEVKHVAVMMSNDPSSGNQQEHDVESTISTCDMRGSNAKSMHESFSSDLELDEMHQLASLVQRATNQLIATMTPVNGHIHSTVDSMLTQAMSYIPRIETNAADEHLRLQSRNIMLTPVLTACYTRHGGVALLAVEGLNKLLIDADFFRDDVTFDHKFGQYSKRVTLLDLAIQTVCDVATSYAMETTFPACVEFVRAAVQLSGGMLNTRTIGYVVRCYFFVFYFGASLPSGMAWNCSSQPILEHDRNDALQEDYLLHDPRDYATGNVYLPGGATQAAALGFKELISHLVGLLGEAVLQSDHHIFRQTSVDLQSSDGHCGDMHGFVESVVDSVVEEAVDHVERANYTQLAFLQIHRSGGSELFWHDMIHSCGDGLFGKGSDDGFSCQDSYKTIFAVVANLVKVATGKNRTAKTITMPREIASKLLSFELLLHFLEVWSDEQEAIKGSPQHVIENKRSVVTLAYAVRRLVVPAMLSNTRSGLENSRVYLHLIRIVTELWHSPIYRSNCKVEIGVLIEHFAIRVLQLGPQYLSPPNLDLRSEQANVSLLTQQLNVLKEIRCWFNDDPKDVVEMFLNYDTDMCEELQGRGQIMHGTTWRVFQRLCGCLSTMAEQCGDIIGVHIKENQTKIMSETENLTEFSVESMKLERRSAIDKMAVQEAARLLKKSSLETLLQIVRSLAIASAAGTDPIFRKLLLSWTQFASPVLFERSPSFAEQRLIGDDVDVNNGLTPRRVASSLANSNNCSPDANDDVDKFWQNAYAEKHNERLTSTARSDRECTMVALEISNRKSLKKAIEYLYACGSLTPAPRDIANFIFLHKDTLDPKAIGLYLSESGIGSKEVEYWNQIRFIYVSFTSFAGMTLTEGLRHFLSQCGFQLPGEAQMIDRLICTFAKCFFQDNAGDSQCCPFDNEDVVYLLSFAIIMLNTDLHKDCNRVRKGDKKMTKTEFASNFRGVECGSEVPKDVLLALYDDIAAHPIKFNGGLQNSDGGASSQLEEMLSNVKSAECLLRGLSVHHFKFATVDDFIAELDYNAQDAVGDLARSCVSKTWNEWYGVINSVMETAHLDPVGMEPCVEILLYALSSTIILDMPRERAAFLNQLGRLKAFEERRFGRWISPNDTYNDESWYLELDTACSGSPARKAYALGKIHAWMASLMSALHVDVEHKIQMTKVVEEILDGDFLMHDPARSFLRSDNLVKKSTRSGRTTDARFYLFSDILIYTKKEAGGYRICEELPLHLMKVTDFFPPALKNRQLLIEIHHPRKSFQILCPSPDIRRDWVAAIKDAIQLEMERKINVEAARMAVFPAN
ncbi:hypothetical protein MPSEU_000418400 [Mayamaea pseudoterrestris]|nr:hypothetical protein MPSEU_000418400 [Mayamaea pseudoterrestris]